MLGLLPLLMITAVALIFGGFYYWARRRGLLTTGQAAEGKQATRRVWLLTEAVAYIGAILVLAGGTVAIGQRWQSIPGWGHVGIFAGAAAFFLLVGILVWQVREPAIQRLADVVWFLSAAGIAGAAGFAAHDVYGSTAAVTVLTTGVAVTVYSAALWLARRHNLQNFALFTGLIVTVCGVIATVSSSAPSLAFALTLWGLGLAWAGLGRQRYMEPLGVTVFSGVLLALVAPNVAVGEYGWVYAIGIATAATAMAVSVPLRNTPLLALGTLALFSYVTSAVVRYFHESLGVPGALTITGVLILALAVVSVRLGRATRPPRPQEPGAESPSHRDLPKASLTILMSV